MSLSHAIAAVLLLMVAASSVRADDFRWLEGEWISDSGATMAINDQRSILKMYETGDASSSEVTRTANGFCIAPLPDPPRGARFIECFNAYHPAAGSAR